MDPPSVTDDADSITDSDSDSELVRVVEGDVPVFSVLVELRWYYSLVFERYR